MASIIQELHQKLVNKEISCQSLVQQKLDALKSSDLNSANYILDEYAINLAKKVDAKIANGETIGVLEGIPFGVKDVYLLQGTYSSASSDFLKKYKSPYTATAIQKLLDAGAIPVVKENCDSFGHGSSSENTVFGAVKNALDANKVAGGSSGGSAVNVAKDFTAFSIGGDTGGSIRQPASHCGVVGFKPSYGRVSRYGLVAFASSLDQIGPLTKSVTDAALLTNVLSGHDPMDSTSLNAPVEDYTSGINEGVKGKKIGVPKEYLSGEIHPEVKSNVEQAINALQDAGAEVVEVSLPHTKYCVPTYYILAPAEASSNLSRFDGVRYGSRSENVTDVLSMYENSREEGFGPEVKRRILLGTYVLSSGYYDAYYIKAQKVRTLIKQDFQTVFDEVDALIAPVSPDPARRISEGVEDPLKEYLADIFTIGANLAGIPAISVPCGTAEKDGKDLPVGLQILGPHMGDKTVLQVAKAWENLREDTV